MKLTKYFRNRVVFLTGASSGIGLALARQLDEAGAHVALVARRGELLERLNLELGARHLVLAGDVSDERFCREAVAKTAAELGRIDCVINNAGISMNGRFEETRTDVFRRLMDVNYFGSLYCSKFALPFLKTARGDLCFVSSIVGRRGFPTRSGYSASKFAVQGLFEALRAECGPDGVHVLLVSPGYTDTAIRASALTADGSALGASGFTRGDVMSAEDAAASILAAIAGKRREVILTRGGKLMVRLNQLFPAWVDRLANRVIG